MKRGKRIHKSYNHRMDEKMFIACHNPSVVKQNLRPLELKWEIFLTTIPYALFMGVLRNE